jgi:hypothetical protein
VENLKNIFFWGRVENLKTKLGRVEYKIKKCLKIAWLGW